MSEKPESNEILELTTEIVASFVSNNSVKSAELSQVINDVYQTLTGLGAATLNADRPKPAVSVKKSITPDYLVCLEDGKKLKMLKRHLKTSYGMTPEQYRERWGLAPDYPMVAPNYAEHRSSLAKKIGLGTTQRGVNKIKK
ncbi:MAG: MucR family transcriptional regulator [Rhodospirillaceae bacterium]|nr:MucR family transcriptional regulator [Rhodospirillaceae bacterium]